MARDINQVILEGNLTRDVELRFTNNGTAVADLGLAVNRSVKTGDDTYEDEPCFVDVTVWQQQAENVAETLKKGDRIVVIGSLRMDQWVDKDTEKNRTKLKVVADSVSPALRWATAEVTKNPKDSGGRTVSVEESF